jgi:hypothetical protein
MNDKERVEKTDRLHILMGCRRPKDNPGMQNLTYRQIIRDYDTDLKILKTKIGDQPGIWRIYHTVNARDVKKALKLLQHKLIDEPEIIDYRIDSAWKKALLKPTCKAEKNFLIDIDTKDKKTEVEVVNAILRDGKTPRLRVETPNGIHLVYEKFDTRLIEGIKDVEFKRDAYYFVEIFENK